MFVSFKTPYVKAFGLINFGQIEGYIYIDLHFWIWDKYLYIFFFIYIYIYIYLLILFISIHICVNEKRIYLFDG